jgi:hypothetical protein
MPTSTTPTTPATPTAPTTPTTPATPATPELSELKPVQNLDEIAVCPEHPSVALCQVRIQPGPIDENNVQMNTATCFQGIAMQYTTDFQTSWDPMLAEYNASTLHLTQQGYTEVCRSQEKTSVDPQDHSQDRYALFSPNPLFPNIATATMAEDTEIFPGCTGPGGDANGVKRTLTRAIPQPPHRETHAGFTFPVATPPTYEPFPLDRAAAEYIVTKFPFGIDGCSSQNVSGKYFYKIAIDRGAIESAIASMRNDIALHSLPPGVDEPTARQIIGGRESEIRTRHLCRREVWQRQSDRREGRICGVTYRLSSRRYSHTFSGGQPRPRKKVSTSQSSR